MKLEAVELRRIQISLVSPFETSFGTQLERDILILKAITDDGEGWGECVAGEEPDSSSEYVEAAQHVLVHHLLPPLLARPTLSPRDVARACELDAFTLLLSEQPLPEDEVLAHAELAKIVRTPICLDESITSEQAAADAIQLGACSIINVKPGRVGGYLEARRIHDLCAKHDVPGWMGGMLETGLGRAGHVAMAAMPNFKLPGDTTASHPHYPLDS